MAQVDVKLEVDPEIIQKLRPSNAELWTAAHSDGSDNRINWNAIGDAESIDTSLGILTAVFQGLRKAFRNWGKTKENLAAEREAAKINRTCGALSQMLLEYIESAQAGSIDRESLDELIEVLEEMDGYCQAGKLTIPGERVLLELCKSIAAYTDALTGGGDAQYTQGPEITARRAFSLIRAKLIRQRQWIGEGGA